MKKLFSILLVTALVLSVGSASAFAVAMPGGINYSDANNDGICDYFPNGGLHIKDGTGRYGGRGNAGLSAGFVDTDGDGICDNNPNGRTCPRNGVGAQRGRNK